MSNFIHRRRLRRLRKLNRRMEVLGEFVATTDVELWPDEVFDADADYMRLHHKRKKLIDQINPER